MDKRNAIGDFFHTRLEELAAGRPEKTAITDIDGNRAGFCDVLRAYDSLRAFLSDIGVTPYQRMAFVTQSGIHMAMLQLPVMENAVLAAIDTSLPLERVKFLMSFLRHDYIITDDRSDPACMTAMGLGIGIIEFKSQMIFGDWNYSFTLASPPIGGPGGMGPKTPDQIMISTTSGTTDMPKVVPLDYGAIIHLVARHTKYHDITDADTMLEMNRTNRNIAVNNILYALYSGAAIIIANGFNHRNFIEMMDAHPVTMFDAPPSVIESLASYMEDRKLKIKAGRLRLVRAQGAPLTDGLKNRIERLLRTTVVENYGMTETKTIATMYKAPCGYRKGSAGVSMGTEIKILDGEILVRGETVFKGYENPEIDNNEYFIDGWFRTGDTGYIDGDGYIFITGRIKEMINRGGEKISPYEVEKAITGISGIREAVVFPYPNEIGSEEAGAAIVLEKGMDMDVFKLRSLLNGSIPAFKMPSRLYVVPKIPLGPNNKVQRKTLFEKLESESGYFASDISGKPIVPVKGKNGAGRKPMGKTAGILKKIFIGRKPYS
ncbi:MAG: AMP-binding protein [Clostridia bacterium]|nr:AMP-binding protein [Clostridia bacterium]